MYSLLIKSASDRRVFVAAGERNDGLISKSRRHTVRMTDHAFKRDLPFVICKIRMTMCSACRSCSNVLRLNECVCHGETSARIRYADKAASW